MSRTAAHLGRARSLIAVDAPAAVISLRKCLAGRNPYTAAVDAQTRDAAELYVRLTHDTPAETATIGWAVYLRRATLHLYGETDPRTRDMSKLVIDLAQRRGMSASPLALTANRVDGGFRAGRAVAARFAVVDLLHNHGLCEAAEREAVAALCQWASHHDDAPDITYTCLVDTLATLDHCGRVKQGRAVLNAYGALLPEAGTEGNTLLRSYVRLRLGNRHQIQHHQDICGRLHRPRRSYEDLRASILNSLTSDDDDRKRWSSAATTTPAGGQGNGDVTISVSSPTGRCGTTWRPGTAWNAINSR